MEAYIMNYYYNGKDRSGKRSEVIYAEDADEAKQKFIDAHGDEIKYQLISVTPAIRPRPITPEQMISLIRRHNAIAEAIKSRDVIIHSFDFLQILTKLIELATLLTHIARNMGIEVSVDKKSGEIVLRSQP